jgi:cytochrome P450 family 313
MVPQGANLMIPVVHIHRSKVYWGEDADEFKPERFEPENFKKVHPYAYMPFSRGPRNCIGYKYAEKSLKVSMAHFFRRFKTSTSLKMGDIAFEFMIVMKIAQRYPVKLHKRDFQSK